MRSNCGRDFTTLAGWPRQILESSLQSRLSRWTGRKGTPHQHFLLSLALVFLCVFLPSAAQAAILTVNVLTDEVEDSCPDTCSIRAALASANAGDEIQFDVTGTIVLTQGELVVDKDLTITGPGAENLALDGNSASRVLRFNEGVTATVKGITVQKGHSEEEGGGIFNEAELKLTECMLSDNFSYMGAGIVNKYSGVLALAKTTISGNASIGAGGGIWNDGGAITLSDSTISANSTDGSGGGIHNNGTLILATTTISSNSGGGIYNTWLSTVTMSHSTLSDNYAVYNGGGIKNDGTLTIISSTLTNNSIGFLGGGIFNDEAGTLTITNSTLSGNSTEWEEEGGGGGIFNYGGTVTIVNSTLEGNSAGFEGGGILTWNGFFGAGSVTLSRSVISNSPSGGNCSGKITSEGDNLSSDSTCITNNRTLNDRNNTDPLLDPAGLQDNGGPTLTIALQPNSPAIDGVRHGTCPPPDTDQRGVPRPSGARCDIGAVEMGGDSAPITVALDIKPGSTKNHINPKSNEKIAVAILSTSPDDDTAEPFDATTIDARSVRFGPKGAKAKTKKVKDVNHDGASDLILYFKTQATGIQCGDTSAELTGETLDGQAITGTDTIKTVGLRCIDPEALARLRRLLRYLLSLEGDHGHSAHGQGNQGHGSYH